MEELRQITVVGLGLLGGSISLAVLRCLPKVKLVGYTHRPVTRKKAKKLLASAEITADVRKSVRDADLVILATPICTFEETFIQIADVLQAGCIVTDVGSTKVLPHKWAAKNLPTKIHYVGSHPVAGSEQRGVEFARDDLFYQSLCILTATKNTSKNALETLKKFWAKLGCSVKQMTPQQHDRIFANVSHLPHITAAALINANNLEELKLAGKGFIDTTRIASGPTNIWADILLANAENCSNGVSKLVTELLKLKKAIKSKDKKQIEQLLQNARQKRSELIKYKIKSKELIS